jgi:hypothetical protein
MRADINLYKEITTWSAIDSRLSFSSDTNALTVINSRRNCNLNLLTVRNKSSTVAILAFLFDNFS